MEQQMEVFLQSDTPQFIASLFDAIDTKVSNVDCIYFSRGNVGKQYLPNRYSSRNPFCRFFCDLFIIYSLNFCFKIELSIYTAGTLEIEDVNVKFPSFDA